MQNAIIVAASVLGFGLILFFTARALGLNKRKTVPTAGEGESERGSVMDPARKEKGFDAIKRWFINHMPSKRRLIQVYAALLYNANIKGFVSGRIYTGESTKYACVPGLNCYSCPGAVGACPLGAMQNALAESEARAPYYIIGIIALFGLIFARTICGFLCPIGMCQELLYKVRTPKFKKSGVTRVLSYFKYVLLFLAVSLPLVYAGFDLPLPAFCKYVCPAGTFEGAILLLVHADNAVLFAQLGWQFTWKFSLLVAFIVASMFVFRVFCRFFCPLGAIYGFFNRFALIGVTVDDKKCTDCGLCVARCKMDVKRVGDHECINCGECISVCPTKAIAWKGERLVLRADAHFDRGATVKPIAATEGEVSISAAYAEKAVNAKAPVSLAAEGVSETAAATAENIAAPAAASENVAPAVETKASGEYAEKPRKKASFWLNVAAWTAAAAVLVGAIVYYNFIDADKKAAPPVQSDEGNIGYNVGDVAPDFTLDMYGSDGAFNLKERRGKIVVVNFWATWCTPCVEEIPYFNELAQNHPELTVVAVHGSSTTNVESFIDSKGWRDYALTFVQDEVDGAQCFTYLSYGGRGYWPMTAVIGEDGKVLYNSTQSFHSYAQLEQLLLSLIPSA